jgi:hypothetical protein
MSSLLRRARQAYAEGGIHGFCYRAQFWLRTEIIKALQPDNDGVYIMEEDWDNLLIIDACPVHVFGDAYKGEGTVETKISRGETTARFFRENFGGDTHYDTIVVSANAAVGPIVDDLEFFKFVGLWGNESEDLPNFDRRFRDIVHPEKVVEKTAELNNEYPNKRIIAHFLQPHSPFVVKDGERIEPGSIYRDFTAARQGKVSSETMTAIYKENTEWVLEYVQELDELLDGKSVITSDHGTLLGEGIPLIYQLLHPRWKFRNRNRFLYAHHIHMRLPTLVEVPWVELDSENRREIVSAEQSEGTDINRDVIDDRLEALGYKD